MADIFVSYKKEDRPRAEQMVEALRKQGRSVWWDDGLTPNQAWDATIEREIELAKAVVVLWSRRSTESEWVRTEAHYAQKHGKLVPVLIEPCKVPLAFALRQAIDLSAGLDTTAAGWAKLTGWLRGLIEGGDDDQPHTQVPFALPALEVDGRPTRNWWTAMAGIATLAALAAALFAVYFFSGEPARPQIVVDRFAIAADADLPASFADTLHDELFASFSASSRITPRIGTGEKESGSFQLTGRVDSDGQTIRVFAQLFAPDLEEPILTARIERPATSARDAAKQLGLALAKTVRCIATASDSSGSQTTQLAQDALKGWAQFCNDTLAEQKSPSALLTTLRAVVAAEPDFANGWSNLAEALATSSFEGDVSQRGQILEEAVVAADRALEIDPTTAKAYIVKSLAALPLESTSGSSNFPAFADFDEWERLAIQATEVRPSDCGCELIQYGFMLSLFGRDSAALPYFERGAMGETGDWEAELLQAEALARIGRSAEAKQIFDSLLREWPGVADVAVGALKAALWRQDWPEATRLLSTMPENQLTRALRGLVSALASNDPREISAAGDAFVQLANGESTLRTLTALGLAMARRPKAAVEAAERLLERNGASIMNLVFEPSFAQARQTREFARLVQRTGVLAYWRKAGRRPDFCLAGDAPALCERLGSN